MLRIREYFKSNLLSQGGRINIHQSKFNCSGSVCIIIGRYTPETMSEKVSLTTKGRRYRLTTMSLYRSVLVVALCMGRTEAVLTRREGVDGPSGSTSLIGRLLTPRGLAANEIEIPTTSPTFAHTLSPTNFGDSILSELLPPMPCANVTLSNTPWRGSYTQQYAKFLVDHNETTGLLTSTVFTALWTRNPDTYTITHAPTHAVNTTDNAGYDTTYMTVTPTTMSPSTIRPTLLPSTETPTSPPTSYNTTTGYNTTYTTTDAPASTVVGNYTWYNTTDNNNTLDYTTIAPTSLDTNYTIHTNSTTRALATNSTKKHSILDSVVEGTLILYDMVADAESDVIVHQCYWILYGGRDLEEKLATMTPGEFIGSMSSSSSLSQDPSVFPMYSSEACLTSPESLTFADTLWNMYESVASFEPDMNVALQFSCEDNLG